MTSKVHPASCRLFNLWTRKPGDDVVFIFGEQKNKERNSETSLRSGKYLERIIEQLLNSAFVGYEHSADVGGCYPSRPKARSAEFLIGTILDLQNSSCPTQPHSIIANYSACTCFTLALKMSVRPLNVLINRQPP